MAKEMAAAHRSILRFANELGHFPLKSHLQELNVLAVKHRVAKYPNHRGTVSEEVWVAGTGLREMKSEVSIDEGNSKATGKSKIEADAQNQAEQLVMELLDADTEGGIRFEATRVFDPDSAVFEGF